MKSRNQECTLALIETLKEENNIDELYDTQTRKLYEAIIELGPSAFNKKSALYEYRDGELLDKMIQYFQDLEEYEKCSELQKIGWRLKGVV